MFPATKTGSPGRAPAGARQSRSRAAPSITLTSESRARSGGTRSRSFSMATTRAPLAASTSVRVPCPGPISRTSSPGTGSSAPAMRSRIARRRRKCWPKRRFARTGLEAKHEQRTVVRGPRGEGVGLRHHLLDDPFGLLAAPAPAGREEPLLAVALAGVVRRVHQAVGPQTEQVALPDPTGGAEPDLPPAGQAERRRGRGEARSE